MNLKLYSSIFFNEIRKLLAYRFEFWINFFGTTIISFIIAYALWKSIYDSSGSLLLNGKSLTYMISYYLIAPLSFRIVQGENVGSVSREVYEGSLNRYIIYPIDFLKYKLVTSFAHAFFYFCQLGIILFITKLFLDSDPLINISFMNYFVSSIFFLFSFMLYFSFFCAIELISFWADNIWSLSVLLRMLTAFFSGALIPLEFFPSWYQDIILFTPFPYFTSIPVKIIIGEYNSILFFNSLFITTLWLVPGILITKWVYNKGLKTYTGVGI